MSVCLTMIVKNEEHVIGKCLASVRPLIDYWIIADTGSTDSTESEVRKALEGIPGEFHHIPWEGFGKCRTKTLELAQGRADYAFVVDADETIDAPNGLGELDADAYLLWAQPNQYVRFVTRRIFNLKFRWQYIGVLHEYPATNDPWLDKTIEGVTIRTTQDGARSQDPEKYLRDAAILEKALLDEPCNSRYVYYLAQCLRDGGQYERAAHRYMQRAVMGPGLNPEEVYCSYLEAGRAFGRVGQIEACERALLQARSACPVRPEVFASLAELYKFLAQCTPPSGTMNVETTHYKPEVAGAGA